MKEYRICDVSQNNKIIGFVKSGSLLLALQKTAWALDLDVTQLYAEEV
jgi:hypothetical protein